MCSSLTAVTLHYTTQCPIAFIRSRACWVIEYFSELDWSYQSGAHLHAVLRGLINGLRDPALPVQAAAACSLRYTTTSVLRSIYLFLCGDNDIIDLIDSSIVSSVCMSVFNIHSLSIHSYFCIDLKYD